MNNVSLVGRMVYEPELKQTSSGINYLPIRLAVGRNDKDKTTDFFSAKAWGKTAEFISKYFHKGDPIAVTGKLQVDSYEKQDGTKVQEVYVYITEVCFVEQKTNKTEQTPKAEPKTEPVNKDLPFEI